MTQPEYISVSLLNQYLNKKFEFDPYLQSVYLSGEISNFRLRPNSHQYFSLKDERSKIKVVMFKGAFNKLKFLPEEGMKVLVKGKVALYPPTGEYQFYIERMEPDGVGSLYQAYEQLKKKLEQEGLFSKPKKSIPRYPRQIAVITSQSGAVIRDIITTANRRFPQAQIILFPAVVQGDKAKISLVDALRQVESRASDFDSLIIGRGGGSIEDLWPFNEEVVVRQLAEMSLPVISSVGHETDTTLSDLVADLRAATPTAAAELATPNLVDELTNIHKQRQLLFTEIRYIIEAKQKETRRLSGSIVLRQPRRLFDQQIQQVDLLEEQLYHATISIISQIWHTKKILDERLNPLILRQKITELVHQTTTLERRMTNSVVVIQKDRRHQMMLLTKQLDELSPLKIISRGFSIASDDQQIISSVEQIKPKKQFNLRFSDGIAKVETLEIKELKNDK